MEDDKFAASRQDPSSTSLYIHTREGVAVAVLRWMINVRSREVAEVAACDGWPTLPTDLITTGTPPDYEKLQASKVQRLWWMNTPVLRREPNFGEIWIPAKPTTSETASVHWEPQNIETTKQERPKLKSTKTERKTSLRRSCE